MIAAIALANELSIYTANPSDLASIDELEVVEVVATGLSAPPTGRTTTSRALVLSEADLCELTLTTSFVS